MANDCGTLWVHDVVSARVRANEGVSDLEMFQQTVQICVSALEHAAHQ